MEAFKSDRNLAYTAELQVIEFTISFQKKIRKLKKKTYGKTKI